MATIDYQAFYDCDSLTSIDLSGCTSLTTIGQSAFERCDKLTTVTLPSTVTSTVTTIGHYAFSNCCSLTSINLSDCRNLERIGDHAFDKCLGLTSINLSGCTRLENIGLAAFWGCSGLKNICFYNVPAIGDNAFYSVISDGKTLTIHCPEGISTTLREELTQSESFTESDFTNGKVVIKDDLDPPHLPPWLLTRVKVPFATPT